MATVVNPPERRVILDGVSWETYERLLVERGENNGARFVYDEGALEIMSPSFEHDAAKEVLSDIVKIALEELELDFVCGGSSTFKREALKRGFEPDSSFYVKQADLVRGKKRLNLETDPPPELILEVDLTNDSRSKSSLYAAMGISEVWRYHGHLEIWILEQGQYVQHQTSSAVPGISVEIVSDLMNLSITTKRPEWARQARARIRVKVKE